MVRVWQMIAAILVMGSNSAQAEQHQRGSPSRVVQTFSVQEQALFGSCNAEDCVLGSSMGNSYNYASFDQTIPVQNNIDLAGHHAEEQMKGFGPRPSFVHRRQ